MRMAKQDKICTPGILSGNLAEVLQTALDVIEMTVGQKKAPARQNKQTVVWQISRK